MEPMGHTWSPWDIHGAHGTYMEPMGHDSSTVFGTPFFFRSHWLIELFEEDESYGKMQKFAG